ncbi:LPS-assembly lipoprotein LptE [Motilimonas pumila]|uniref:LPS-assembly lipoprotein LptE n=1 Tax=Motilimonas pumila TaxID=2303987 RepID=A0A418YK73_9GAMM|nr:LPS assembly lipoprotein LptE [Motilimonas pumila]RJG51230.1 hypothetical protein D1Z90_00395 [Motilimonas pumila]
MQQLKKASLILATLLLLSACGFKPKGYVTNGGDIDKVYLQTADPYGPLTKEIERQLRYAKIEFIADLPDAEAVIAQDIVKLVVSGERQTSRVISLYDNASTAENEISYSVSYQILRPEQSPLAFDINIVRDSLENPQQALASSREDEMILRELQREAAYRIVRQLTTLELESSQ